MKVKKTLKTALLSSRFWWIAGSIFVVTRIATWLFPYDSDHWIFYYVGKHWLDGQTLYLQIWDHKSPLIFAINGGMHALFGDNIILHRILFTVIAVISLWMFYRVSLLIFEAIGRKSSRLDARIATLLFAFWANLSQFTNSGNNTENFGVLALLIAIFCYLKWRKSSLIKWLLYSGIAVSFLVFFKINFALLLLPLIIDLFARYLRDLKKLVVYGFVWIIPTLLQALLWFSYFSPRGLLKDFWIATVSFNGRYLRAGWGGELSGQAIFIAILFVAFLFFAGAFLYSFKYRREEKSLLPLIAGSALFFSAILGTFYTHYYLIVIPYFCVIGAAYWRQVIRSRFWTILAIIGFIGSFGISLRQLYNRFYGGAAADARAMTTAAEYIKDHTNTHDKIIFYGYGATFYELAKRDSGSRYISASHPLIDEREGFGYDFTDKYIGDMAVSRPAYVIVDRATIDIYDDNTRAMSYFTRHYTLEKQLPGYDIWKRAD